jgi:hypothetical protein
MVKEIFNRLKATKFGYFICLMNGIFARYLHVDCFILLKIYELSIANKNALPAITYQVAFAFTAFRIINRKMRKVVYAKSAFNSLFILFNKLRLNALVHLACRYKHLKLFAGLF